MSTRIKLPKTDSIEKLAQFWDTHDLTDFEDEIEETQEPVFERRAEVKIHLEPADAEVVFALARSRGVSHTRLIREWILERIQTRSQAAT